VKAHDAFSSPFSKASVFTSHFQKTPLLKPFLKVSILITVYEHFSVDDRQKYLKKCAFHKKN